MANLNRNSALLRSPHRPTDDEIQFVVKTMAAKVQSTLNQLSRDIGISPATAEQIMALVIADVRAKTLSDGKLFLRSGM